MPSTKNPSVVLRDKRERSVLNHHPWLFSGAIAQESKEAPPGSLVDVLDGKKTLLARGFYNPSSNIRVRVVDFKPQAERSVETLLSDGILNAVKARVRNVATKETGAFRIINTEGDGLSGLIVDGYEGHLVVQALAVWVDVHKQAVMDALRQACDELFPIQSIRFRYEKEACKLEGMKAADEAVSFTEDPAPRTVWVREGGLWIEADLEQGQKTGLFLDQRQNRLRLRGLAQEKRVLNLFCHNGGFSLNALAGQASQVTSVDVSAHALESLSKNLERNGLESRHESHLADVKRWLPQAEAQGLRFDLAVCDPPPFARRKEHRNSAARAYKDINRRVMDLLDDGLLMSFSCSPFMDDKLFSQILFSAALEAGREVTLLERLGPGWDHPVSLFCPEGDYLRGLLLHVRKP